MTAPGKRRVLAVFTPDFDRMTKLVRQHKIVKGGKLQKSESALICVVIAEVSTKALPVFTSILAEWAVLWICTGRNKTFPHSTSLPVMSEIAGVNTASRGGFLHSSNARVRWAEGFHDELNGHVFDLERNGLRQV